ncbi:MAG: hypothetical protein ABS33_03050 [Verrucomicrobia subdivision 6 bacterium BACL9 MAG-120924-bin69]|uniref:Uncharacterized protein n=1 Tax=Verrucomicrobia subdivision 6 bacterium BACL9 MAG-120924-bin69 TaxID=1655635 RepID=A0A0R2XD02_9BACT|nr:MAG: hypothetical protein ABS33_03050 [Verrucomicrobia subdivision 6 bacterium BACL9 MAG-120924-bin69]
MVADRIKFNLRKSCAQDGWGESGLNQGTLKTLGLFGRDLNKGLDAKVTDANDAETVTPDSAFGLLNRGQPLGGDR